MNKPDPHKVWPAWVRGVSLLVLLGLLAARTNSRPAGSSQPERPALAFEMRSSAKGRGQLFVDYGTGHSEEDSTWFDVVQGEAFHAYKVPFPRPDGASVGIRLDPIDTAATVTVRSMRIVDGRGRTVRPVVLADVKPIRMIEPPQPSGADLHISVPAAEADAGLVIEEASGSANPLASAGEDPSLRGRQGRDLSGAVLLGALCLVAAAFPAAVVRGGIALASRLAAVPSARIIGSAIIGTVIAAYPVIFCGMSYVAPPFVGSLYDRFPWVPGNEFAGPFENLGIDDGASYWTTIPNTVVQHESIFEHGEFPFWNRYVGGGIPLYAQGQSMIGDPLHWITVLARGSSLSWDIKTILEKCLFAAGIGFLVRRLTGSLRAAMILAFTANFLGFFQWRLNHPALFVITYCPWVILAWMQLARRMVDRRRAWWRTSVAALSLATLAFIQLNSGGTKEAVVAGAFANACGCLLLVAHLVRRRLPPAQAAFSAGIVVSMVALCTAPYWLLFLDALRKSYTIYSPAVYSFAGLSPLLFFEPFFMKPAGWLMTSTNLAVLVFAAIAVAGFLWERPVHKLIVIFVGGLALSVAFGVFPDALLLRIPLVQGIHHVGNTFAVAAITPVLVTAGFGMAEFMAADGRRRRTVVALAAAVVVLLLLHWVVTYRGGKPPHFLPTPPPLRKFAALCTAAGLSAILAGFLACLWVGATRAHSRWPWYAAAVMAAPLLLRNGVHVPTRVPAIDVFAHVVNADPRVDYEAPSPAITSLKAALAHSDDPLRVLGEGRVLFPGFNIRYLLEGVVPVEPLRNRYMDAMLEAFDYPDMGWGWLKLVEGHQLDGRSRLLDMLNVGYVLAMPDEPLSVRPFQAVPFWGTRANECADVDGDGRADLVAWNEASVWVALAAADGGGFTDPQEWLSVGLVGDVCNHVKDVDGDGRADLVAWNRNGTHVAVAKRDGTGFESPSLHHSGEFFGSRANLCADVDGDGRHDLVAWNDDDVWACLASDTGFGSPTRICEGRADGDRTLHADDVDGDGRADFVAWGPDDVLVARSRGSDAGLRHWSPWYSGRFHGNRADGIADVDGDGCSDLIAWSDADVRILFTSRADLAAPGAITARPATPRLGLKGRFHGDVASGLADVDGDGRGDLIAWNKDSKWVAVANGQGTGFSPAGLSLVHSSDLDVWKRETAWPRAFYTSTIAVAAADGRFVALAEETPPPFAIVSAADAGDLPESSPGASRPAREYVLTGNSTAFTVDADGPGMIVLQEGYYAGDFVATVNGRRTDYLKVNGVFKGIPVAGPGTYRVTFTYRPARLGAALAMSAIGIGICLLGPGFLPRSPRAQVERLVEYTDERSSIPFHGT